LRGLQHVRSCARGIVAYGNCATRFVCIFPYDVAGAIIEEETFTRLYPRTYEYLASQRPALLTRRSCGDRPWYALRTVDVARVLDAPKLVAIVSGRPGQFALDTGGVLCHNSVLTISVNSNSVDPYFLLGILNSGPMRVRCRTLPMGEGHYAHRLDAVRQMPIPVPGLAQCSEAGAEVSRYARMLGGREIAASRRLAIRRRIDRLAMQLYALPKHDAWCVDEAEPSAGLNSGQ
jgi:hypothetical protein